MYTVNFIRGAGDPQTISRLLPILMLLGTACTASPGADSMQELRQRAIDAIQSGDYEAALGTMLVAEPFVKHCRTRIGGDEETYRQRLANNHKRLARYFEQCAAMLDGAIDVTQVRGGQRRKQAPGCDNNVWQYSDIVLKVKTSERLATIRLDGILAIEGRFYIVERIACR